eukprot:scaffold116964_cov63-Phaeocystis_antarctica.AAC.1
MAHLQEDLVLGGGRPRTRSSPRADDAGCPSSGRPAHGPCGTRRTPWDRTCTSSPGGELLLARERVVHAQPRHALPLRRGRRVPLRVLPAAHLVRVRLGVGVRVKAGLRAGAAVEVGIRVGLGQELGLGPELARVAHRLRRHREATRHRAARGIQHRPTAGRARGARHGCEARHGAGQVGELVGGEAEHVPVPPRRVRVRRAIGSAHRAQHRHVRLVRVRVRVRVSRAKARARDRGGSEGKRGRGLGPGPGPGSGLKYGRGRPACVGAAPPATKLRLS